MNRASSVIVNHNAPQLSAEDAWRAWHQLSQIAESLWIAYEQEFLQFCIEEAKDQGYSLPSPFD